ncbi:unnamed protein product [Tetraodon nigroviridis]|uniref:Chromosome 8 SCAF15119, whole genome shotgun sequence n=1 Tax=Tetraodon nigroviridis TaxID=99883 RepID=Q4RFF5_TETNG|nr:unnamed protein product [Tetraodon nigroviridis]
MNNASEQRRVGEEEEKAGWGEDERGGNDYQMLFYYCATAITVKQNITQWQKLNE